MEGHQPSRLVLILGLVMLAAAPAVAASPPEARVVLNTDRYVVGSKWTLDLIVDTPDPLSVRVPTPPLPPGLSLLEGPYIRETSWEKVPGSLTRATKVSFTLRTTAPGIGEVGPFEVRVGSQVQTLAPVTVYLLATDEAKRRFPSQVGWVKPEGPFYEGQAITLLLQARNLDTLEQPGDVALGAPSGSLWEKAVGLGEIEINSVDEDRIMNIPWGGWMLIPTKPGTLTIPAFQTTVAGLNRSVPPLTLDIQPLPADVAVTRAVGNFSYTVDAKPGDGALGGALVVTQEITGRGNFPYLVLPDLAIPGLSLVSRQEGTHYRASKGGYEGSLVVTWRFSSDRARQVDVDLPGFRAFQPGTGLIDAWDARRITVDVNLPDAPERAVVEAAPLDWQQVVASRPWMAAGGWMSFLLFLPGPLVLAATFLPRGRRKGLLVLLAGILFTGAAAAPYQGFEAALQAEGSDAADRWTVLADAHPDEPGLWYNKALACRDANRTAEAVHAFRMAMVTGFQGDLAARGLAALEEKELLTDQFLPWTGWPTNLLWLLLCLAANLTFLLWALQRVTGSSLWLVPLAAAMIGTGAATVFVVGADAARRDADAVVGLTDGPIRKVPGDLAENWMTLKAGTIVRVQGVSDRWKLVQTGYGLEGWVETSSLLPLEAR